MKLWILLVPVLVLTIKSPTRATGEEWGQTVFPIQTLNLGDVAKGSNVEFSFPVINALNSNLIIESIDSNCGCTMVQSEKMTLAPGERSVIIGEINTDDYSGRRKAILTVRLSSPSTKEIRLRVDSFIRTDLVLYPGSLHFSDAFSGLNYEKKTTLMHAGTPAVKVKYVQLPRAWIQCEHQESFREGDKTNIDFTVKLTEDAPVGEFHEIINLVLDDETATKIPLMVSGTVAKEISVSPKSIFLSSVTPNQSLKINLIVIGRDPVVINKINSRDWNIEYEATNTRKRTHLIPLRISPKTTQGGTLRSTLRIEAEGNDEIVIETPINAMIEPPTSERPPLK